MNWPEDYVNKIICGDCLEVMKGIPDGAVDLVLTDPPYGLDKRLSRGGGAHRFAKFRTGYVGKSWDELISDASFAELFRVSLDQIIFGANYYTLPPTRGIICWDKAQHLPTFSRWEYAWSSFDCPARLYEIRNGADERCHPTQKPEELMRHLISDFSEKEAVILDPFAGSGTACVAAKQLGRKYIGIEISPDYCKIAEDRLRQEELF